MNPELYTKRAEAFQLMTIWALIVNVSFLTRNWILVILNFGFFCWFVYRYYLAKITSEFPLNIYPKPQDHNAKRY